MLTENQTIDRRGGIENVVGEAPPKRRSSLRGYASGVAPFLAVVAQFGLIVLVVNEWQLENLLLSRLMALAFVGFIIHHLLPFRFRLPFFAILSLVAVIFGLGEIGAGMFVAGLTGRVPIGDFLYRLIPGLSLVGLGLGLIGLCHLPIRFWTRVGLVAVVGAVLVVLGVTASGSLMSLPCGRFWDRCSCSA